VSPGIRGITGEAPISEDGSGAVRSVLIVDDNEDIRDVLRMVFEIDGFKVVGEASNGVEAVTVALEHRPDFVILDYLMPLQNGEKTAEILRTLVPETRIVAFSGVISKKPDWADAFLTKDRVSEILPMVRGLL
jgi:CheY-like chemotaxis protein